MKPTQSNIWSCAVNRNKILPKTKEKDFLDAIASELLELAEAKTMDSKKPELADIVLICYSYAQHYGFDLDFELSEKHKYNLTRKD